jgi:hypothetical protein
MTMAEAFNEWMRRSLREELPAVQYVLVLDKFRRQVRNKKRPTFGDQAAAYLRAIMREPKRVVGKRKAAKRRRR